MSRFSKRFRWSLKKTKIVNFDITHWQARGENVPEELLKKYQTVKEKRTKQYPKEHKKILSSAFRTDRSDIYFEKNIVRDHFKSK